MNTAEMQSPIVLSGRKLTAVRAGWWLLFLIYALFRVCSLRYSQLYTANNTVEIVANITSLGVDVITWALAIVLFVKKSQDWTAILVTVMFFTWQTSAQNAWGWLIHHGWFDFRLPAYAWQGLLAQVLSIPFDYFALLVGMGVFLTFPTGHWISRPARRIFRGVALLCMLFALLAPLVLVFKTPALLNGFLFNGLLVSFYSLMLMGAEFVSGGMLFRHYRRIRNSLHRQQIKWIVVFLALLAGVYVLLIPLVLAFIFVIDYTTGLKLIAMATVMGGVANLGLFGAFSLSIFRYRLWDVEFLLNKALIYSGLTAMLGMLGVASTVLIDYGIRTWLGEGESSLWAVLLSALPVAAAFRPLQNMMQKWVDRYFKPEEVDFTGTFIEFTPAIRELLTTEQIAKTVAEQVRKQLNVDFARLYLLQPEGRFGLVAGTPSGGESAPVVLEEAQRRPLQAGETVCDEARASYSLLVPLVVPRARIPDFLGIIILGRRLNGKGYSTKILDSLQSLGAEAGKAIYLSQISALARQKNSEQIPPPHDG